MSWQSTPQKSPSEVLTKARALIADPKHWIKDKMARKADGSGCWESDPEATCWCALGALRKVAPGPGERIPGHELLAKEMREALPNEKDNPSIITHFNDTRTHKEVIAAFDRAIAQAETLVRTRKKEKTNENF